MNKTLIGLAVCFFVFSGSVFGQAINRNLYTSIDPFDYKLNEADAATGQVRRFRSVVQFRSSSGTRYVFSSLDRGTTLTLNPRARGEMPEPASGQIVTIYFTATKRGIADVLDLDMIDYDNTTEEGIGLVKSAITRPTGINRAHYRETDLFTYQSDREFAARGEVRRLRASVLFSHQDGINFSFADREEGEDGRTLVSFRVQRRFPPLAKDQRVTIYFTATRGTTDSLVIDDIEF